MTNQVIPVEAVEAAAEVFGHITGTRSPQSAEAILQAAAPYMRSDTHPVTKIRYVEHTDPMWEEHERTVNKSCTCDYVKIQNGLWLTIAIRCDIAPDCSIHGGRLAAGGNR